MDVPAKPKNIVVVGTGVIGLSTAYMLSLNPLNRLTILDRNKSPYLGTSERNGCYLHTQGSETWINKPFKEFVKAVYKRDHFSKVYLGSFLSNPRLTLKFGYLWFFN